MGTPNDDRALRPGSFEDFVGQEDAKRNLRVLARTAKARGEAADHVLLSGPPGLGKTSLAAIMAAEMGARLVTVNAPAVRTKGDLAAVLTSLRDGDVLFLDEVHSLRPAVEEILYPAMEDGVLQVVAGSGDGAEAVTVPLARFTLVAATTRPGMVSQPLRDRFGETVQLQFYSEAELEQVVLRSAARLDAPCTRGAARELARRSRGTPRVANRLLRRARDFAQDAGASVIDSSVVADACRSLGVDEAGLDRSSRRYLEALASRRAPVGLEVLAALLGESRDALEESVEPYLMRAGLIERTAKGRVATAAGVQHAAG